MTVETFTELCELTAPITYKKSVRSAKMGDGYEQVAENGINSVADTIALRCAGDNARMREVRAFLLRHVVKAFIFTPPGEEKGLYRVDAESVAFNLTGHTAEVTFTLNRAYGVFA
ncbi:minor tail protein M [Edwardsiella phage eiAU-183]|uniref:Minor tail protein M n=4 Tax=Viruses TaxID=10239 RepID=E7EKQ9_9CAUD|nr:minor tail protein [Edwardsiella phage eiAU-183]YP_009613852.1 minor tail protein [Edwardsiella phage eiAU]ADV36468.1 minor tail protein M [Edwardsiella phage eiDWF]ADV36518.1 minor tail protein M [Edwardsiella phage eiMSLS]ADV36414.1 minor tail protein M [Edwardsiella phage eiAU]AHG23418.1 minor tail protein M [Edwardsiella phage eiAU]AHG23472.1 minor tail protein M [Edwardsiella phage eiAU-183]